MRTGSVNDASADGGPLRIGPWRVDPVSGLITREGRSIRLEPRVMAVLLHLAGRPQQVVSREELEQAVWSGRPISYDALTTAMLKLRRALEDDARSPAFIETVSKRGYRLVAEVVPAEVASAAETGDRRPDAPRRGRAPLIAGLLGSLALIALFVSWYGSEPPPAPDESAPLTLAVLPFQNFGGAGGEDYFADGMTDDLITALAKNPHLFVIARDSVFLYKQRAVEPRTIAERLHVRYLLRGSVRRTGGQVRINAQLIDAETATHLWAEQYAGTADDLFALQDAIVHKILAALKIELEEVPVRPRRPTDPRAYDYFLDGRFRFFRFASPDENLRARERYRQAVGLDPEFALAHAMLAWTYAFEAMNGWSEDRARSLEVALQGAQTSLAINDSLPVAYFVTGLVYRERGEYERARREAEKALALEPSYANAHVLQATLLYYAGEPEAGLAMIQRAMRLNPHHPYNYPFHLGQAYFILGNYAAAAEAFSRGLETNPSSERLHLWLAAAYARAGALDDARWEADQVKAANPGFSLARVSEAFPFRDEADLRRFTEALELAGLTR